MNDSDETDKTHTGSGSEGGAPAPEIPTDRIGKYALRGLLGKGGMGAVYRAFDPFLEREVALKAMLPQIAEVPEHKQRFEREARAVARLTHPNVVTVFDLGYHTDGAPYIVMELLQGEDLLHITRRRPDMPLAEKVGVILQVLDGLGHAHKAGIVHRDIKPANIFISKDGTAKIMDFGIARLGPSAATGTGAVLGTASYMSPEQVQGQPVDGRSDLFSVGSVLCELLAGQRPFDAETPLATMYQIANNDPLLDLPEAPEYGRFRPVLQKALARDPNERYATSKEFARALSQCLDEPAATARPPSPAPEPAQGAKAPSPAGPRTTRPLPRPTAEGTRPTPRRSDPRELFRILRDVYVGGKSGHLHFTSSRGSRSLRVLQGRITHAISDRDGEHLGEVLVRYGLIRQDDLEHALENEKRLGPVLSGMGLLDHDGLEEALGLHVREILFAMLEEEGTHSFEELFDAASEAEVVSKLSTGQVILEATRRVLDPELVRRVLGDMDRVLVLSNDPLLRHQPITLTPTDGFVLSRVDGTLSARDVINLSPVPPEDTERSLFGLICTGIVDYKDAAQTTRTRPQVKLARNRPGDTASTGPPAHGESPPRTHAPPSSPRERAGPASSSPPPPPASPRPAAASETGASPPDPASAVLEAERLFAAQRHEEAMVKIEPLLGSIEGSLKVRASMLLGQASLKTGTRSERAESALLEVVREDPTCTPAYFLLGVLYRGRNDRERARSMYQKVLELSPNHRGAAAELSAMEDG
jgi:serine/threonine protein kinase